MRVIELANVEKNKKWPYQINQRENGYSVLYSTVCFAFMKRLTVEYCTVHVLSNELCYN